MNSTINKAFYTGLTKSLFLKHQKISKKVFKLGNYINVKDIYFQNTMAASKKSI